MIRKTIEFESEEIYNGLKALASKSGIKIGDFIIKMLLPKQNDSYFKSGSFAEMFKEIIDHECYLSDGNFGFESWKRIYELLKYFKIVNLQPNYSIIACPQCGESFPESKEEQIEFAKNQWQNGSLVVTTKLKHSLYNQKRSFDNWFVQRDLDYIKAYIEGKSVKQNTHQIFLVRCDKHTHCEVEDCNYHHFVPMHNLELKGEPKYCYLHYLLKLKEEVENRTHKQFIHPTGSDWTTRDHDKWQNDVLEMIELKIETETKIREYTDDDIIIRFADL